MRLFILDMEGSGNGLDLALRAKAFDHSVRYWLPSHAGGRVPHGDGLVDRAEDWEPEMEWADLIVTTGNSSYVTKLASYFGQGYPIFGTNAKAAELELNREVGQQVLEDAGIETLPYVVVGSAREAIDHIVRTGKPYVLKPWGGAANKAMTFVAGDPSDAVFTIERWEAEGLFQGQLMLQEMAEGVEIGIAAWFGPGGWSQWKEESFEHKKFMNGDLGENTGEQGTVIRHVKESKLFDLLLKPLTDYLHRVRYTGDCSVNCIVDDSGIPYPLEFTMRLGWPDFVIRQEVIDGDPVQWMADLLEGKDSFAPRPDVAVGIVLTHGDFPRGMMGDTRPKDSSETWAGYPVSAPKSHIGWQQVMKGTRPVVDNGAVRRARSYVTSGNYVAVALGSGPTVVDAMEAALKMAGEVRWASNRMYRTDIGARLEKALPKLQRHGIAKGMRFASSRDYG